MIEATVHLMGVYIKICGSKTERKRDLQCLKSKVPRKDLRPMGPWQWKVRNPYKYAEKVPQIAVVLEDARRQLPMFSAKELARIQSRKYTEFFFHLTLEEQLIILECAAAGLRDELADGFLRENGVLDLDLDDEILTPISDKIEEFLGAE